jgi:elongation factor P
LALEEPATRPDAKTRARSAGYGNRRAAHRRPLEPLAPKQTCHRRNVVEPFIPQTKGTRQLMAVLANDLRKGMAIRYNGNPAIVLEVQHRTPGNLRAFVQAIIRYINTGKSADVRFGSTDKVDLVDVNRRKLEFSYSDPQGYHFMDPDSFETVTLQPELVSAAKDYLTENLAVDVLYVESKAVEVELPSSVQLKVIESAEGVRGDSANNVQKPAKLETGKTIQVPLFIKEGEIVKIDTRTGNYMGRA